MKAAHWQKLLLCGVVTALFFGCDDESPGATDCLANPEQCPAGTRCAVDAIGNAFCQPNSNDNRDARTTLADTGVGGNGGNPNQGGAMSGSSSAGTSGTNTGSAGTNGNVGDGAGAQSGNQNAGGMSGAGGGQNVAGSNAGDTQNTGGTAGVCSDFGVNLKPSRGVEYTARVMLAVDRSKSINDWNGWAAIEMGIQETMNLLGESVQFGLTLFPNGASADTQRGCEPAQLDVAVGFDRTGTIMGSLETYPPSIPAATPTSTAIQIA